MRQLIQNLRSDFSVNHRLLDRLTVTAFRINQWAYRGRLRPVKRVVAKLLDALWMQGIVGSDMPGRVVCGAPLRLPHGGRGIVLHPNVTIGDGVTIYHRVTMGVYGPDPSQVPSVADGAYIGAGAALVGRIYVGEHARIGANAAVTKDVPAGYTAVGAPAQNRAPKSTVPVS